MEQIDITIIGAGVIGLSIASFLAAPKRKVFLLEKNDSFGQETSSRNSEVIHSGIYYPFNSLKHRLCVDGRRMLYDFCSKFNIKYEKTGKLIVAQTEQELDDLEALYQNGVKNEVEGLKIIDEKEIKKIEPNVKAIAAISSPETGIMDSHALMKQLLNQATAKECEVAYDVEVIEIKKKSQGYEITVKDTNGENFSFYSTAVINTAGLNSDKVASLVGIDIKKSKYELYYSKGQYFRLYNHKNWEIYRLIYPLPDKKHKSLGIHLTPDLNYHIRLGPDAHTIEASKLNYDIDESAAEDFFRSVKEFVPLVEKDDLYPDTAGIRPKLGPENNKFRDFIIKEESEKGFENFINLLGIESPGLTSSLAIGKYVENLVKKIF
ncbi:NAD(P)/FAD-dependent oxidoreductase [Candidatus Auribacterota bacterium]